MFINTDDGTVDFYSYLITNYATGTLNVILKDLVSETTTTTNVSSSINTNVNGYKYTRLTVADGVYQVTIQIKDGNQTQEESACLFMDGNDILCQLADAAEKRYSKKLRERDYNEIILMHYTLKHIQDCRCNCEGMANIYKVLKNFINKSDLCGCSNL